MIKTHNKMNVLEQDKSVIQNMLHSWHKKTNIKCPTCKSSLFLFDGTPYFSSVRIINEIVQIHHSTCLSSIGNCGKALFFCLSCGSQSSHTSGRLQDRGCKCVRVNNNKAKNKSSEQNPAEESVMSNNDHVGYEVADNNYEPASEQWGDSEVNSTMGNIMNPTEDSGVRNNHHLGYEEHGRTWKLK